MSDFQPTTLSVDPPRPPDELADAIMRSLGRDFRHRPWGPVLAFVLGALSFGILPVLSWSRRLGGFVIVERRQLWHLAEWLHLGDESDSQSDLRPLLKEPGRRPLMSYAMLLVLLLLVVWAAGSMRPGVDGPRVWRVTYGIGRDLRTGRVGALNHQAILIFSVWTVSLLAAYMGLCMQTLRNARDLARFAERFNAQMARRNLAPIEVPGIQPRLVLLWGTEAIVGLLGGALWALPAALAGANIAGYFTFSTRVRQQMALRVHEILRQRHPGVNVPMPLHLRPSCPTSGCGAALPAGAGFCPRCGTRIERQVDARA